MSLARRRNANDADGVRVGNRTDGVATDSSLYTNRHPAKEREGESTFPIRFRDPRSGSVTANLHRMILANKEFHNYPPGNSHKSQSPS